MTREEALRLLGLGENATEEEIKLAYREMAQILHPDKYADNKRLAERATEQFKHVNEAREVLLSGRASARRSGGRTRSARAGSRTSDATGYAAGYAAEHATDRASMLKARLAGIAAARVQLTTQLDAELDRRRLGVYLTVGGLIGLVAGRFVRFLLAIAPLAIVWGIVQLFSSQASIKIINGHLAKLERDREKCEKELDEL
jgi:hypothetical protein